MRKKTFKAVAEQINTIQRATYNQHRHAFTGKPILGDTYYAPLANCLKGSHARTQGVVKGKLIVPNDLPRHLKQTLFDHGAVYPVVCRYSSEPGDPGLDVKCHGAEGWPELTNIPGPDLSTPRL